MKKLKYGFMLILCLFFIVGCGNTSEQSSSSAPSTSNDNNSTESSGDTIKIGALWNSLSIPAVQIIAERLDEEAERIGGIEIVHVDTKGDAQTMHNEAKNLITQGVQGLIMDPADPQGAIPTIKSFHDAEIPVVTIALNVTEEGREFITSFVGPDDIYVGELSAELMIEALGEEGGNVVVLEGATASLPAIERTEGFKKGLEGTNINILELQDTNWNRAEAMSIMQNFISKYGDEIDGLFGHNDDITLGGIQAIKQAGRTDIKVVGYGAYAEALEEIKNDNMYATGTQPLTWEADQALQVILDTIEGKEVEKWYQDEIDIIRKDNVDSYTPFF